MPGASSIRALFRLMGLIGMAVIMVWPAIFLWACKLDTVRSQYVRWFYAMAARTWASLVLRGALANAASCS